MNNNSTFHTEEWLTVKEAATLMKVTERTIYNHIKEKTLAARKFGRLWRIPREEIIAQLAGGSQL